MDGRWWNSLQEFNAQGLDSHKESGFHSKEKAGVPSQNNTWWSSLTSAKTVWGVSEASSGWGNPRGFGMHWKKQCNRYSFQNQLWIGSIGWLPEIPWRQLLNSVLPTAHQGGWRWSFSRSWTILCRKGSSKGHDVWPQSVKCFYSDVDWLLLPTTPTLTKMNRDETWGAYRCLPCHLLEMHKSKIAKRRSPTHGFHGSCSDTPVGCGYFLPTQKIQQWSGITINQVVDEG